jgi:hypothetical protein
MKNNDLEKLLNNIELTEPSKSYTTKANQIISAGQKRGGISWWNLGLAFSLVASLSVNVFQLQMGEDIRSPTQYFSQSQQKNNGGYEVKQSLRVPGIKSNKVVVKKENRS